MPFELGGLDLAKFGPQFFKAVRYGVVAVIALHLLLGLLLFMKGVSLKTLDAKWQSLQSRKLEIEKVSKEQSSLEKIVLPMRQLTQGACFWSRKLNKISELITAGVWLTRLSTETQGQGAKGPPSRILELRGYAASAYGDETGLIGKFAKALQDDKDFAGDFSEIKIGPMEKETTENAPVMNFKISCLLKKE